MMVQAKAYDRQGRSQKVWDTVLSDFKKVEFN